MNIHDMTEQAYKNGYEAGVKALAETIKKEAKSYGLDGVPYKMIDDNVTEMTEDER